jgi:hypothetical protein
MRILSLPAVLVCAALAAAQADDRLPPGPFWRIPVLSVPLGRAPKLDGEIRKGEYLPAARLQDFVLCGADGDAGYAAREQTMVLLSYSAEALHVGVQVAMEEGAAPKVTATEGRDTAFNDDAIEIFLVPEGQGTVFHIGGTSAGVWWDRRIKGNTSEWEWNPAVQYKALADAGRNLWVGEFIIPFADMGRATPKEGEEWRANFVTNRRAPNHRLDAWSYWRKWSDHENNGRVLFGGKRPVSSMLRPVAEAWTARGACAGVSPHADDPAPRKVDARFELRARPKPGGNSFLRDLQLRRDQATGEGATFATFEKDLADSFKEFPLLNAHGKIIDLPVRDWTGPWGYPVAVDKVGDYVMAYAFTDVTEPARPLVISAGAIPFRVQSGVQAKVYPYLLTRQSVLLFGDLRAVPEIKTVRKLRGAVSEAGKADLLASTTVDFTGDLKPQVEVGVAKLPSGRKYDARLQALDAEGKVVSEGVDGFNWPETPDWWVNRAEYGSKPEVPPPWTPVDWKDGTARVWGRELTFGAEALPARIVTAGADLLAAPVRFELRAGGATAKWSPAATRVIEARPGHVLRETTQEAAGVRLTITTRLEFDGFMLTDVVITPVAGKAAVEGLDLVMTLRAEHAQFLTNYRNAPGPGPSIPRYVGKTPAHYESPVMLTTWLGTDRYGLEWSAESARDWFIASPKKSIEVDRKGDTVEARFHFIDAPTTLARARSIRFGLVPTPVKPVAAERQNWRIEMAGWPPPVPGVTSLKEGGKATAKDLAEFDTLFGDVDILVSLLAANFTGTYVWHPYITDAGRGALLKQQMTMVRERKKRLLVNGGWAVAPYGAEWDPWGKEMVAWPITPTFANQYNHSYAGPFVEFFVGSWARNAREYGLNGIRFDTVFPWMPSENPYLGETWTSDSPGSAGKVFGTQSLYRQREMVKRLYRIFNGGEVNDGIIYHPLAGPPIMAVESFVDIHEIGEGAYMHAATVKEAYPADAVRVWMTATPYGFLVQNNLKGTPLRSVSRLGPLLVAGASPRFSCRPGFDFPTYDPPANQPQGIPTRRVWAAWQWIDRATAQWMPYWENQAVLTTDGKGERYVSFHLQKGRRVLLVAANYEREAQSVTLKFNRDALGFPPGAALEAQDAVTLQPVPVKDGQLVVEIGPENFRMVKIGLPGDLAPVKP